MRELEGRVALVTGAASGIGLAAAKRLSAAGASVATLDLIEPATGDHRVVADMGDDLSVANAVARVREALGHPDIVVHAAAHSVHGSIEATTSADFAAIFNVNVIGAARLIRTCAPKMREAQNGAFVMMSSINARFATPTLAAYAASKAALENLTMTSALELAPYGIRVNAVAPASIDTPLLQLSFARTKDPATARAANVRRHPLGRLGTAEDVAELVLFLASERASWITGSVQLIDGGAHVTRS